MLFPATNVPSTPQKRFLLPRRIAERFISDQSGYAYYAVIAIHINVLAPLPSNAVILHRPFCLFLTYSRSRSFYPSSLNHLAKYPEAQCWYPGIDLCFNDPYYDFKDNVPNEDRGNPLQVTKGLFTHHCFFCSESP